MSRRSILFTRRFDGVTGGHLKVSHYMQHCLAFDGIEPHLHIDPASQVEAANNFFPSAVKRTVLPAKTDLLFVGGEDWDILDRAGQSTGECAVINLIQHVRHADPKSPMYKHLARPAVRVCVSQPVAEALKQSNIVNGPIVVVENGIDLEMLEARKPVRKTRQVLISGLKNPSLAHEIGVILSGWSIPHVYHTTRLPRADYLELVASSTVNLCLPDTTEGFYLPALESMAMGTGVVVPHFEGAGGYCRADETCLVSRRTAADLADAATALLTDPYLQAELCNNAATVLKRYSLKRERSEFHDMLRMMCE